MTATPLLLGSSVCLAAPRTITVAPSGDDFATVQEAVAAAPAHSAERILIHIRPGTYQGQVHIPKDKSNTTFEGDDAKTTVITCAHTVHDPGPGGKELGTDGGYGTINGDKAALRDCRLTSDGVPGDLGRPWRPYANVAYIDCEMDKHILPVGWDNRGNAVNEKTARYAEYGSKSPDGKPIDLLVRAPWAKALTESKAARYRDIPAVPSGWNPNASEAAKTKLSDSEKTIPLESQAAVPTPITMNLWPGDPPDKIPGSGPGADDGTSRYRNVGVPGMLAYLPPASAGNAKDRIAVIVCPGGGYTHLTRLEGANGAVAAFLPQNMVVVSLKYRLKPPSTNVENDTLADVKRAIRLVRAHAEEWGVSPNRIGVLGWSAGANLALNLASHFDAGDPAATDPVERENSRPDFVVLLSPWPDGQPLSAYPITQNAPPAFIGTASDDRTAPPAFALGIADAYHTVGVRAKLLHVETGGHRAFTIDAPGPGGKWPGSFRTWLTTIGIRKETGG